MTGAAMFDRLGRLVRDLTGRNDQVLVDHLLGQVDAALRAVDTAREVAGGERAPAQAVDVLHEIEHEQDNHRDDLVAELAAVLAPPMDREDLVRLSRSVDDVLANLVDLNREMHLFGFESSARLVAPLEGVGEGLGHLRDGIEHLVTDTEAAQQSAREAKHNGIRAAYQEAVADLLDGDEPVTTGQVKQRIVLRRVDVIGLRLGEAADALLDGTIKRND